MGSSVQKFLGGTDNLQMIVSRIGVPPGEFVEINDYDMQSETVAYFAVQSVFRTQRVKISSE